MWEAGQPHGIVPAGIGVYGTTGRLEKAYRAFGFELDADYTVVEADMAWWKVKSEDFVGKEAHLAHREAEPVAKLCTLTIDDHTTASGMKRYPLGREPVTLRDGTPLTDAHGRRSYVTSTGAGPSIGKHIVMSYLPPEHANEGEQLAVEYMTELLPGDGRHRRLDGRPSIPRTRESAREILVCVKRVPITGGRMVLTEDAQALETKHLGFTISPHEECAVEEAVRIVEAGGGEVVVLTLGPAEAEEQLRDCMAIGADRGILLKTDGAEWDAQATAAAIVDAVRGEEPFDLLLFGNESADAGNYQVGIRVAYALGLPVVTGLKKIELADGRARVRARRRRRRATSTRCRCRRC